MEDSKLKRINELARKSRTAEGLTPAEKAEQAQLRQEYIALFRGNLEAQLNNMVIVEPDGSRRRVTKNPKAKK